MHARLDARWLAAVATMALACGGGGGGGDDGPALSAYVPAVTCTSCTVEMKAGAPPAEAPVSRFGAALAAAAAEDRFLRGGTTTFPFEGSEATRFIVAVEGVDGYWEIRFTGSGSRSLLVTFGQDSPESFALRLGAGEGDAISYQEIPVTLISVGTGDVQVNVTWDLDVDVDLHVLDPSGEEIFYGNEVGESGGELDLDSNAGCSLDHVRAENITWASGTAPSGTYRVLVDYYSACSAGPVNYVVTVNVAGRSPQTFEGSFGSNEDDGGGECFPTSGSTLLCGELITTFTVP
jgi:hypothetical protein